jgi:DNA-binding transcriptional LysR family regulator
MDARQLELFLAVLDSPTMTKAAERLHLSPAAVSLQLHSLADELKTDLFVRSGRKLMPTPAAARLREHATRVLSQMQAIRDEFAGSSQGVAGPFHLATGATTLIYRLRNPLRLLRQEFPKLNLHVTVLPTEEIVAGLLDRQFDLGLISLPFSHPHLEFIPLFEEELLLLRPSSTRAHGWNIGKIRPQEFANAPFLLFPKQSNMRTIIDRFFAELGVQPQVTMEASDTEVIKSLVEVGFGYSILPEHALRHSSGFFQTMRVAGKRLMRQQALAIAQTSHACPLAAKIAQFLKSELDRAGTAGPARPTRSPGTSVGAVATGGEVAGSTAGTPRSREPRRASAAHA